MEVQWIRDRWLRLRYTVAIPKATFSQSPILKNIMIAFEELRRALSLFRVL